MTERKGALAGALIVREHQELVFISQSGMVQRTSVRGISKMGRSTQGVKVMNLRGDDTVSAVALVQESEAEIGAPAGDENGASPQLMEDGEAEPEAPDGNGAA
jgi:DNA gyrase subunit A